jgi:hypothetical protein
MTADSQSRSWLIPTLRFIKKRPQMFLWDTRLISFACHIEGIAYGLSLAGKDSDNDRLLLKTFGQWLGERLKCSNGDCWFYLMRCYPDATGEVSDFFDELDVFLKSRGLQNGLDDEQLEFQQWTQEHR